MVYVLSAKQVRPITHTHVNGDTTKYNGHNNNNNGGHSSGQGEEEGKPKLEDSILRNLIGVAGFGLILIIYSSIGAWIFVKLEAEADKSRILDLRLTVSVARHKFSTAVSQLHLNKTSNNSDDEPFNLEAFTKLLKEYEEILDDVSDGALKSYIAKLGNPKGRWNFFHSLLFVFTLVTTIGYGNLTPKTTAGRVFCVMFALLGIPLALIEIALSGKLLAGVFVSTFGKVIKVDLSVSEKSTKIQKLFGTTLTILGVLNLLIGYTFIGAFLYDFTESWGFINSFYFCFTTLTTVGFGDLVPTSGASGNPFAAIRVVYVLFGLALTSTSFELIRQQYSNTWVKKTKTRIKTPALYVAVQRATRQSHGMLDAVSNKTELPLTE